MGSEHLRTGPDPHISRRRAARLYKLVRGLAAGNRSRSQLLRVGRLGVRTLYRDLKFLESIGIELRKFPGGYRLAVPLKVALQRLPFPSIPLSFADVMELGRGGGAGQAKLRSEWRQVTR